MVPRKGGSDRKWSGWYRAGGRKNVDSLCAGQSFSLEKTRKFWNRW